MIDSPIGNKEYSSPNCTFFCVQKIKNKTKFKKIKIKLNEHDVITL